MEWWTRLLLLTTFLVGGSCTKLPEQPEQPSELSATSESATATSSLAVEEKPRAPGMWDEPESVPGPKRKYRIGICFSVPAKRTSMYTNGSTFFAVCSSLSLTLAYPSQEQSRLHFFSMSCSHSKIATRFTSSILIVVIQKSVQRYHLHRSNELYCNILERDARMAAASL